jgi:peptide chain release factor
MRFPPLTDALLEALEVRFIPETFRCRLAGLGFSGSFSVMSATLSAEKIAALGLRMSALAIIESELIEKFIQGSGAGGQKINKTSSCVFLKHLASGITVKCQNDRSREMNRYLARHYLCEQLEKIRDDRVQAQTQATEKARRQKRPRSARSKQRSTVDKRITSQKKSLRRSPTND